ncbi:pyridoxal-dependent decarboxylase [Primorskyibacter aestuariivivens]|uniref:pyridoxal phosphate-dependent decarboxylase family protein n=1 Tax=Primorskyibacter aestuariivivens TaxID=1888912 RepID=UPI002301E08A|nr:pyridoxal-dependent decarboxylase [Primorskyibacter aestuariivivens]MDA7427892.1 pyridoxal-dependent decarboxylase [Primorskyibacter aestuariivivens]
MTQSLDPKDWTAFRTAAHDLLDQCIDQLANARNHPWRPVPEDVRANFALDGTAKGESATAKRLASEMLPYGTGNTHPRFFGWVHGTGLASGLMSEMVAATLNSNCGGRDHGMIYVERAVIDWTRKIMGFPETASGVLVTGTSQATVVSLAAARLRAIGPDVRTRGQQTRLTAYAGAGVHNATLKAIELLGIGSDNLRLIPQTPSGLDLDALRARISEDRANGATPFVIIGTAGSVDFGLFDDLNALADIAQDEGLWLHVDGAFGAWTRLADAPWRALSDGIDRADSIACDFHKWMYVPYDCGLCLIRDEADQRAAFAARPAYLAPQVDGLAGGDPWFCDYGIDLSRGNRALKVWTAIESYGAEGLGAAISDNCRAARHMGQLVSDTAHMALMSPVVSNLCVFTADTRLSPEAQSDVNSRIARELQVEGVAVFSTTSANGITCLRAAITNHRTRFEDVDVAFQAVVQKRG